MLVLYKKHINLKVDIREVRKRGRFCKHERGGSHFNIYVGKFQYLCGKNVEWGQFLEYGMTAYMPFFFFLTNDKTHERDSLLET